MSKTYTQEDIEALTVEIRAQVEEEFREQINEAERKQQVTAWAIDRAIEVAKLNDKPADFEAIKALADQFTEYTYVEVAA